MYSFHLNFPNYPYKEIWARDEGFAPGFDMLLAITGVNGKPSKSLSPQQAAGHYGILPLRVQVCSHISSGLSPADPSVPAIHPTSKLAGILAYEINMPS